VKFAESFLFMEFYVFVLTKIIYSDSTNQKTFSVFKNGSIDKSLSLFELGIRIYILKMSVFGGDQLDLYYSFREPYRQVY
jgi:hypothetical protein